MSNTLKTMITLVAVVGFLAGCSSNSVEEDTSMDTSDTMTDTSMDQAVSTTEVDVDPLAGVDHVFYFDFDQAILKADSRAALMIHAEVLKDSPKSIRLEGHADERGSREYNMALGERRANAVRDFLILQGVSSSLIETVSYGEERPAEVGGYDSAWSKNRRVEL
uniref:peptidoglycan-associated lipoprotein Pal n=1 Tax=Teredinibacter waterburyi TaxID=1500538 RepID=UPI00165FE7AB